MILNVFEDSFRERLGIGQGEDVVNGIVNAVGERIEENLQLNPRYQQILDAIGDAWERMLDGASNLVIEHVGPYVTMAINYIGNLIADMLGYPEIPNLESQAESIAAMPALNFLTDTQREMVQQSVEGAGTGFGRLSLGNSDNATAHNRMADSAAESSITVASIRDEVIEGYIARYASAVNLDDDRRAELKEMLEGNDQIRRYAEDQVDRVQSAVRQATLRAVTAAEGATLTFDDIAVRDSLVTINDADIQRVVDEQIFAYGIQDKMTEVFGQEVIEEMHEDGQFNTVLQAIVSGSMTEADLDSFAGMTEDQRRGFNWLLSDNWASQVTNVSNADHTNFEEFTKLSAFQRMTFNADGQIEVHINDDDVADLLVTPPSLPASAQQSDQGQTPGS